MGLTVYHQKIKELYPDRKPPAPEREEDISLSQQA